MFLINILIFAVTIKLVVSKLSEPMLEYCLKSQPNPGIIKCVGQQALTSLQTIEDTDNYTITNGLLMIKNENSMLRSIPNILDQDPMDIRGILENAGAIIGQRTLQWELGMIYPGLCLRIGPSSESNSVLEFIMDPNHDRGDRFYNEESSTARILTKQFIVPFLLGLKFNLITILPLVFAGIILLCKKAAILGKIALFMTGLLGFGSIFSFGGLSDIFTGNKHHYGGHGGGGGGGLGSYGHDYPLSSGYYKSDEKHYNSNVKHNNNNNNNNNNDNNMEDIPKKEPLIDNFYNYEKKVLYQDRNSNQFPREIETTASASSVGRSFSTNNYRNFGWRTIDD